MIDIVAIPATREESEMSWRPTCPTGTEVEEEVIGHALVSWNGQYVPFHQSLRAVKSHQPWDPSDPEPRFASDLHASVALALGLDDWSGLEFYTAVGSPLDFFHGVDCFFCFKGKIVTIDLTINSSKQVAKADLVVNCSYRDAAIAFAAPEVAKRLAGGVR